MLVPLQCGLAGFVQERQPDLGKIEQVIVEVTVLSQAVAHPGGDTAADAGGAGAAYDDSDAFLVRHGRVPPWFVAHTVGVTN
ncbi:hypothetical protein GCM10009754_48250 [Amycolatopsis minnesotensis]|uniref:Uncharacterized protein n=1 Tax=Amycolatopsis minnesotensis TaxID=337894 RepID=A0ABP5CUV9_9PSEU